MTRITHSSDARLEPLEPRAHLSASPTSHLSHSPLPPSSLHAHPNSKAAAPRITNPNPVGLTPAQVRQAYNVNNVSFSPTTPATGAGQTIAIVDAYDHPSISADLAMFSTTFSLPQMNTPGGPTFKVVKPKGLRSDPGWAMEIALDVEWAHAIAPGASILLVEARSNTLRDLIAAVDVARNTPGVSVVSMSWGCPEFSNQSRYDTFFTTPAGHTPVTFVAATGDDGAPLNWPAASPNVLAVGGTTLAVDDVGNVLSESAWVGSTGGISAYARKPDYQAGLKLSPKKRTGPDLSYAADAKDGFAVYDSVPERGRSGWARVGGTSAGAPQIAALIAIANQGRSLISSHPLDGRSETLPSIYAAPKTTFRDITTGASTGKRRYPATKGYDLATGRGSPFADSLVSQLLAA